MVPLGCSLFGISNDVAMQIVGVGFIVSVIQDSMETALNSSGDAIFTATAEFIVRRTSKCPRNFKSCIICLKVNPRG